jgi:hypothetical protein
VFCVCVLCVFSLSKFNSPQNANLRPQTSQKQAPAKQSSVRCSEDEELLQCRVQPIRGIAGALLPAASSVGAKQQGAPWGALPTIDTNFVFVFWPRAHALHAPTAPFCCCCDLMPTTGRQFSRGGVLGVSLLGPSSPRCSLGICAVSLRMRASLRSAHELDLIWALYLPICLSIDIYVRWHGVGRAQAHHPYQPPRPVVSSCSAVPNATTTTALVQPMPHSIPIAVHLRRCQIRTRIRAFSVLPPVQS